MKYVLTALAITSASIAHAIDLPAPVTDADYAPVRLDEARLGQLLFYDPILSGNRNISCGTCHHPKFSTGDGVSLSLGEGGIGLGPDRRADPENMPEQRIPRHAQALFNLGAQEFTVLFHDGRIEDQDGTLRTPLGDDMTEGFASILSAQTMFPVLSPDEMAGHYSENDVSKAVRTGRITGPGGAWDVLSRRVSDLPDYVSAFEAVYPHIAAGAPIAFTDISNAIAAFVSYEWRSDDSLFDQVLRGEATLDGAAIRGAELFYGEAKCATCHSGVFHTDHDFHVMGEPQFGPGKAARFEDHANDVGRMRVTGQDIDKYAFRTPSLRNVTRTAPYGHTGSYSDLSVFLRAHTSSQPYDRENAILPELAVSDWRILDDPTALRDIAERRVAFDAELSDAAIADLIAFLTTLEDKTALGGRLGLPDRVPSGLPIDR
ncbi:cytochrome-c peroxidase [Litoreibacter roseus]|uniref:Methylamine utilization protein MauG n=1 Tax=Litoreibacter roseus TaxID=2601869 RepID=A0A6N6JIF7_9RHOB|nr:cytochrome c peroxidase [Litoreibacter roseus]GFE66143.1 methylamine utilization protein MauG [Litoreibacter roseus]